MPYLIEGTGVPRDQLVIPDDHRHPKDNWRRFEALGNYIVKHQPEVVVFLGDSADMESLSSYDEGKKSHIMKNVSDDIESFHKGEEVIFNPLILHNRVQAKLHKKQYEPKIVKLRGNHEDRVRRLLEYEPKWEGSISMDSFNTKLSLPEFVVPFLDYVTIDGVYYSHYFPGGVKGLPIGTAKLLCQKKMVSCTAGHLHMLDSALCTKPSGERVRGLIAGCFIDPDTKAFGGPQVTDMYWSGLIHKRNVQNGDYDMEEISVERLLKEYL